MEAEMEAEMKDRTLVGGCACGAVRYSVKAEPVLAAHCHCRHCQVSSGAAYATVMGVPRAAFQLEQGSTATYAYTGDSGNPVVRHFCPHCGCPLFSDVSILPDLWFVRVTSLDAPEQVTPTLHIYCDSAQPWDQPEDGLPRFATMPG